MDWLKERICDTYDMKHRGRLRPEPKVAKSVRILNRVLWWVKNGNHYEPDQRHVDILTGALGLTQAKSVITPGETDRGWESPRSSPHKIHKVS